jgi:uncharacterized membrane protein (DUF4010 family)
MTPLLFPPDSPLDAATRLGVAALAGLAVGIEREWSGHARGHDARFAGLRTFLILGLTGGLAGLLSTASRPVEGAIVLAAGGALVVAAFILTMRRPDAEMDATTEAVALAILGLGFLAGGGQLAIPAGATALLVLVLGEKQRLHGLVDRFEAAELQAAARFAVMALVILPLLPSTVLPFGSRISPRSLWTLVLFFTAINFGGYLARRAAGPRRGYAIAGALGGLVSSTLVTLQFARRSREEPEHAGALALGTVAACTILPLRLLAITAVLSPSVSLAAVPYLLPPALLGAALVAVGIRRGAHGTGGEAPAAKSPLNVLASIRMVLFFWVTLLAIDWLKGAFGSTGVLTSAVVLGLTDTDALTVAMARLGTGGMTTLAAQGIAVGVVSNTAVKLVLALVLGSPAFRRRAGVGLFALGAAVAVGMFWTVSGIGR